MLNKFGIMARPAVDAEKDIETGGTPHKPS